MTEKIKVNVTKHVYTIILKDAESFEFFKNDNHTFNKNALLTSLIVNYYETFQNKQSSLYNYLNNTITNAIYASEQTISNLCYDIAEHINRLEAAPSKEKFDCVLSIKPTKQSQHIIDYIENYLLGNSTLSEYFRNMFSSYANLPQDEREKIIFRPQYLALVDAIENKRKVFLRSTSKANNNFEFSPYAITQSKEELHGYLLGSSFYAATTVRLSRIISVTPLNEDAEFTNEQIELFEKMMKYGPQFSYGKNEGEVAVKLTKRGIDKFSKIYIHRPLPDRVEGDVYYFNCSHIQLFQYFLRFGRDAYVLYPESLKLQLFRYFSEGRRHYNQKKNSEE